MEYVLIKGHTGKRQSIIPIIDNEPFNLIVERWQKQEKEDGNYTGCTTQKFIGTIFEALKAMERL